MYSSSDFEKVWFLYKIEGEPKGISINAFCEKQGVPYDKFEEWFRRTRRTIVPVEVEGMPEEIKTQEEIVKNQSEPSKSVKRSNPKEVHDAEHCIRVMIQSRNGIQVQKSNLTYPELLALVEKLEGLC